MKNRHLFFIILAGGLFILLSFGFYTLVIKQHKPVYQANISNVLASGLTDDAYAKAIEPRKFTFPKDAGPHPQFRSEWWYYTGNLTDDSNRQFGYQLTLFRQAIHPEKPKPGSKWRSSQIYMGHFAVTDVRENKFYSFNRMTRQAANLAGAQSDPYRVWVENWEVSGDFRSPVLKASEEGITINLKLNSEKPEVLQGNQGLSQKSKGIGNASYYFSQTRLRTTGTIQIHDHQYSVNGNSWLDREWSTSILSKNETGWDWFSLQLQDNRELMLFVIRQKNGAISPYSAGTLVFSDNRTLHLKKGDFTIQTLDNWVSPKTKIKYPSRWQISIPEADIQLDITPTIKNQEHTHNFIYWEGAVKVTGESQNGKGYVELVGY